MSLSADAYARQLKQLLPRGILWAFEPGSVLSRVLLAIADEMARIDGRSDDLLDEWDPRSAFETLSDWERVYGIPDGCVGVGTNNADRQAAVTARVVARGGSTPGYFVSLAAALGFVATIQEFVGPFTWRMNVDLTRSVGGSITVTVARAGTASAGDYLQNQSVSVLECVINRAKRPTHTVLFAYTT